MGTACRQALDLLTATEDCQQASVGDTLRWTEALMRIAPPPGGGGSPDLVPGTLAEGSAGFMLKDGTLAHPGAAAR